MVESEWTIVKSKNDIKKERMIQKEILQKSKELDIIKNHTIFHDDTLELNFRIIKNKKIMDFMKNN